MFKKNKYEYKSHLSSLVDFLLYCGEFKPAPFKGVEAQQLLLVHKFWVHESSAPRPAFVTVCARLTRQGSGSVKMFASPAECLSKEPPPLPFTPH